MTIRISTSLLSIVVAVSFSGHATATTLCPNSFGGLSGCGTGTGLVPAPSDLIVDGQSYRTYDGTGNNIANPTWGQAGTTFLSRDGATVSGTGLTRLDGPDARDVSEALGASGDNAPTSEQGLSSMFWAWGQFIDHDITLTKADSGNDALSLGGGLEDVTRSNRDADGALTNSITAYIDGSMVYGSSEEEANHLRANDGTGRLTLDADGNLPRNAGGDFMAGDERVNEQQQLTAMHTVFAREHNRIADTLSDANPDWSGERVYQESRSLVGAQIQAITYNEWLPKLLGSDGVGDYTGYDAGTNAGLTTEFSTCAFRFCHSMIPDELERLAENGDPIAQGHLKLRDGFFSPEEFIAGGGTDPLIRGLAAQEAMAVDAMMTDELRNFLDEGGFEDSDLLGRNIARGRDNGLADYNMLRAAYGLPPINDWSELSDDPLVIAELTALYGETPDGFDPFIGALMEKPLEGALVGALNGAIIGDQFDRLRDGDRFWYENIFQDDILAWINDRTLSDILLDNTGIKWMQNDVFVAVARGAVSAPGMLAMILLAAGVGYRRRQRGLALG